MVDAVAGEDLQAAVVHHHGKVGGQLSFGGAQHLTESLIQAEYLRCNIELLLGHLK